MLPSVRRPQKLRAYVQAANDQVYRPAYGLATDVLSRKIRLTQLSDEHINYLVRTQIITKKRKDRSNLVLEEGVLDASGYDLGLLVVNIQYDFKNAKPIIEVPGKYDRIGGKSRSIWVKLLNKSERTILEDMLKPDYSDKLNIWPGDATSTERMVVETPI